MFLNKDFLLHYFKEWLDQKVIFDYFGDNFLSYTILERFYILFTINGSSLEKPKNLTHVIEYDFSKSVYKKFMNYYDYEEFRSYVSIYKEYQKMDEDGICEQYLIEQFEKLMNMEMEKLKSF